MQFFLLKTNIMENMCITIHVGICDQRTRDLKHLIKLCFVS